MNLKDLQKKIPYQWRVQSYSKHKPQATCVAYIDARAAMDLLDEVVGYGKWQSDYKEVKGNVYGGVGIHIDGEWVWKWDCGVESNQDAEKGQASDAFKRACVKWGIGRFLYDLEVKYVEANEIKGEHNYPFPVNAQKQRIWDLTTYINNITGNTPIVPKVAAQTHDMVLRPDNVQQNVGNAFSQITDPEWDSLVNEMYEPQQEQVIIDPVYVDDGAKTCEHPGCGKVSNYKTGISKKNGKPWRAYQCSSGDQTHTQWM